MTNAEIIIAYASQVLNGHDFHFIDVSDLMAARKERIWIKEEPKPGCVDEKCPLRKVRLYEKEEIPDQKRLLIPFEVLPRVAQLVEHPDYNRESVSSTLTAGSM